jgi:transcriptional regulator with XRE-family HTH domain
MHHIASDVRLARVGSGLSLRDVATAAVVDHAQLWRFERRLVDLPFSDLAAICQVLGMDLSLRAYPAGDPLRDVAHARLLERLRSRLHPELGWTTEVPLPGDRDLRAWDAMIRGSGWRLPVEAETVVTDVQALERKLALKVRDGGVTHVLLAVADTRRNRRSLASAPASFASLPLRSGQVLRHLRAGTDPGASGLVIV